MTALLEVSDLRVAYGAAEALHGISLQAAEGEVVALLGANGAGKSTLLRAVSGVARIVGGSVRFAGADTTRAPPAAIVARGLIHVPEGREIFAAMSVRDNIMVGGFRFGRPRDEDIESVLDLFPRLRERFHQLGGTLSGGEQQMLAIGRGLVARPKLLLLDEPSLGLAPIAVEQLFRALATLKARGLAMLVAEQNAPRVLALADRAYVLAAGQVRASGTTGEIRASGHIAAAYLGISP